VGAWLSEKWARRAGWQVVGLSTRCGPLGNIGLAVCREIGNYSAGRRKANLDKGEGKPMRRKLFIGLGILFVLSTATAKADDIAYAYCPLGEGYVFLYDSPTSFQVLANLKCGQKLTVVDARDRDRTRVRTADGKEGYVVKSTITAPQRQPATAPNASTPQAQPSQPQAQAQPQPQVQPQPQSQPQPPAQPQPEKKSEPEAQPQPAAQPAQPQPKLPSPPQLEVHDQPEPTPQTETHREAESQPPVTTEPPAQPQAEPHVEAELRPEPEPQPQPQPESQPTAQSQPQPAATAFTPFSTLGYGQNVPRMEFFGGFSYLNAGTNALTARQNVVGFEGAVSVNLNRWIGAELNLSGYYKTIDILGVATVPYHDYSAMAGPRINMHKAFFHALVGIDHLAGSANFYNVTAYSKDNVIAGAAGGGVQWNVARQLALRTSADYVMSRFGGIMQNNFRVTLGFVFQAGSVSRGE